MDLVASQPPFGEAKNRGKLSEQVLHCNFYFVAFLVFVVKRLSIRFHVSNSCILGTCPIDSATPKNQPTPLEKSWIRPDNIIGKNMDSYSPHHLLKCNVTSSYSCLELSLCFCFLVLRFRTKICRLSQENVTKTTRKPNNEPINLLDKPIGILATGLELAWN